jgi:hypothetical protein
MLALYLIFHPEPDGSEKAAAGKIKSLDSVSKRLNLRIERLYFVNPGKAVK